MSYRKVCIYGAGAIGAWIGARLAQAGCERRAWSRAAPRCTPCSSTACAASWTATT